MPDEQSNDEGAVTRRLGLFPAEIFVTIFGLLTLVLFAAFGVSLRHPYELYVGRLCFYMSFYLVALLLALPASRLGDLGKSRKGQEKISWKTTFENYRASHLRPRRILNDLRFVNCIALVFFLYFNLKHLVPHVNPSLYDAILLKTDRLIFSGQISGEWLQGILGYRYAEVLSSGYTLFYGYTFFLAMVFILPRNQPLTQEFFTSFVLLWFVTILVIYAVPTLGPCFYVPEYFANIPSCKVTDVQAMLWKHKMFLDKFPKSEKGIFAISGFPSLHLAVPILGALYFRHFSRFLAWLSWVFVGITILTTLYFGWHYLLDDVGAFLLVFGVMRLTRLIFDKGILGSKQAFKGA
jgi:hypothetical protein